MSTDDGGYHDHDPSPTIDPTTNRQHEVFIHTDRNSLQSPSKKPRKKLQHHAIDETDNTIVHIPSPSHNTLGSSQSCKEQSSTMTMGGQTIIQDKETTQTNDEHIASPLLMTHKRPRSKYSSQQVQPHDKSSSGVGRENPTEVKLTKNQLLDSIGYSTGLNYSVSQLQKKLKGCSRAIDTTAAEDINHGEQVTNNKHHPSRRHGDTSRSPTTLDGPKTKVGGSSTVYLSGVLEYITHEVLNLAAGVVAVEQRLKHHQASTLTPPNRLESTSSMEGVMDSQPPSSPSSSPLETTAPSSSSASASSSSSLSIEPPPITISSTHLEYIFNNDEEFRILRERVSTAATQTRQQNQPSVGEETTITPCIPCISDDNTSDDGLNTGIPDDI